MIPRVAKPIAALLLVAGPVEPADAADYKSFFGKTVAFRLAICRDGEACDPGGGAVRTIQFDAQGGLSENFMLGDKTKREHRFGATSKFRLADDGTKKEKSIALSGSGNTLEIVATSTLTFSDGSSDRKIDRYRLTTTDGNSCTVEGSRSILELPGKTQRSMKIAGGDCEIRP